MSKEAIRTGRYTQQLKQSFQSEIRQFERRKSQQQTQGCHTDIRQHQLDHRPGLQHKDGFQETAETQQFERRHTRQQPLDTPPTHTELGIDPFVDISCTSCSADDYDDNDCDCDGDDDDEDDDTEYDTNYGNQHIISMDSSRLEASSRVGPNGESVEEIIHTIVHAYHILPSNIKSSQDYLDKMAREYLEQYQLKEKLFGKMSAVSAQEFTEIFS
ncbi:hypothetical protein EGW08_016240 [Elysia chlorotica]|uniref:Uncharacterized protein n=1 Tax=Elysia chlorotica TaxID=188477 RepID=A0A3S1AZA4_ELYCH|nr:hypothetical protein EGW08_016240 [Elysia chlorotica]